MNHNQPHSQLNVNHNQPYESPDQQWILPCFRSGYWVMIIIGDQLNLLVPSAVVDPPAQYCGPTGQLADDDRASYNWVLWFLPPVVTTICSGNQESPAVPNFHGQLITQSPVVTIAWWERWPDWLRRGQAPDFLHDDWTARTVQRRLEGAGWWWHVITTNNRGNTNDTRVVS